MVKVPGLSLPLPNPNAMLLCDTVIREGGTGKPSLIGVFENINVHPQNLPTPQQALVHPTMTLYAKVTGAEGEYEWRFELVRMRDNHVLAQQSIGKILHPDRMKPHDIVVGMMLVPFFELGKYAFRLYANNRFVGDKTFEVVALKEEKT